MREIVTQRLKSGHVSKFFGLLKRSLESADPDMSESFKFKEMQAIVSGAYQAWAVFEKQESGAMRLAAMMITKLRGDVIDVRSVTAYTPVSIQEWKEIWKPIAAWAKENKCRRVTASTSNPRVIQVCRSMGWDTETRLVVGDL